MFDYDLEIKNSFDPSAKIILMVGNTAEKIKEIPNEFVNLIITSPPYNLKKEYESRCTLDDYLEFMKPIISELVRVLSPTGSLCWQVGNYVHKGEIYPLDIFYYEYFKKQGLKLRNRIIWYFGHGLHAKKRFSGRYETILWFTKTDNYTFNLDSVRIPSKYPGKKYYKGPKKGQLSCNPLGKNPSDVWETILHDWEKEIWEIPNVKSNHPEKTIHPCQFPIELAERCILALTNENDWVFDPFSGVGSALIAAVKNNRKAIGCEKEEKYVNITKQRFYDLFSGKLKYRPLGKKIYSPFIRNKDKIEKNVDFLTLRFFKRD